MAKTEVNPVPVLGAEKYASLRASIERDGITVPIVISGGPANMGQIVDGFHRRKIWVEDLKRPAKDIPSVSKRFLTEAEFRIAQITLNLERRQLTTYEAVVMGMALEPWQRVLAQQRRGKKTSGEKSPQGPQRATAAAAAAVGLKRDTFEHAKFVIERAPASVREQFAAGLISVDRAFKETKRAAGMTTGAVLGTAIRNRLGTFPRGAHKLVVVDPPWRAVRGGGKEAGRLAAAEIAGLPVDQVLARDALLVLWAPSQWLGEAVAAIGGWGGKIVTAITWVKESGDGELMADVTEHALIATVGRPELGSTRKTNVIEGRGQGGRAPAAFWKLVQDLAPEGKAIALFSAERDGWDNWAPVVKD